MAEWINGATDRRTVLETTASTGATTRQVLSNTDETRIAEDAEPTRIRNRGPEIVRVWRERKSTDPKLRIDASEKIAELTAGESADVAGTEEHGWRLMAAVLPGARIWSRSLYDEIRKTKSKGRRGEALIRRYLTDGNIPFDVIPERDEKSPDLRVYLDGHETVWEIKTLNDDENGRSAFNNSVFVYKVDGARRLRSAAERAQRQLETETIKKPELPTVLAIVDQRTGLYRDPYADELVAQMLYGHRTGVVTADGAEERPRRNAESDKFRWISAVAMLQLTPKAPETREAVYKQGRVHADVPIIAELILYHNSNAHVKLNPELGVGALAQKMYRQGGDSGRRAVLWKTGIPVREHDGAIRMQTAEGAERSWKRLTGSALTEKDGQRVILDKEAAIGAGWTTIGPEQDDLPNREPSGAIEDEQFAVRTNGEKVISILDEIKKEIRNTTSLMLTKKKKTALQCASDTVDAIPRQGEEEIADLRVERKAEICGGSAVVKNRRLLVHGILGMMANGCTPAEIEDQLEIEGPPREAIIHCIEYAQRKLKEHETQTNKRDEDPVGRELPRREPEKWAQGGWS